MLTLAVLSLFFLAVFAGLLDCYQRTGFHPPLLSMLSSAFGGAFWTLTQGFSVVGAALTTFTHSLGIAPANLFARVFLHQTALTATGWPQIGILGTNIISVAIPVAQTATLLDIEVGQQHSLIS